MLAKTMSFVLLASRVLYSFGNDAVKIEGEYFSF